MSKNVWRIKEVLRGNKGGSVSKLDRWANKSLIIALGQIEIRIKTGKVGLIESGPAYSIGKTPLQFARMIVPTSSGFGRGIIKEDDCVK
jgi:hypothetical protein